jgi:predicted RNA-binding Zn ribbon-like protein
MSLRSSRSPRSPRSPRSARKPASASSPAGELRDGFKFRGGHPALDLTASLAGRRRAEPTELLAEPADLGRWLVAAGLLPRAPQPTLEELASARELREALYRLFHSRAHQRPLPAADRAVVNRWAAFPAPAPQLSPDGALTWTGAGVASSLAALARAGVELLGGPSAGRIRACSGEGCALVFLDASRAGERRWCSMASCGNKAKVSSFRRRERRAL